MSQTVPRRPSASNWLSLLSLIALFWFGFTPPAAIAGLSIVITHPAAIPVESAEQLIDTAQNFKPRNFIAEALDTVGPTVVRIDTEQTIKHSSTDSFFDDPSLREFFGPGAFPRGPHEDRLRGQGSGFIIDETGIVLTNAHVVSKADTVTVTLKDGREYKGEVRGVDEVSDLAVVKLKDVDSSLPVAPLGNSEQVEVGDWAIAVGNPVGLDNTVTLGIVSTLHRTSAEIGIPGKRLDFIQTDAAINPGNSGGPLLSDRGEVIGINTAIRADAMGIGFAIPIDKAKSLKDRLVRGEQILHPYIGVQMTTLTPEAAQENNRNPNSPVLLPETQGVLVVQVFPNTPAALAGIRWGDVILSVDDQPVQKASQLQTLVENCQVGQQLQLEIQRGEQTQVFAIRTGELQGAA
ncbi:Putative serine protease HhoA [Acaryochloris thomasi RCC1774]|uniref:Serine protease HhoA n=1 Tax=Acaryochloris thomasi RCC1774 TaxID=1764569 RepID=A0A2W1JK74_9CYAN|nr:HhoA/HhoB/HtrA family serine endopeptidase [Acaryochloris thomasi]PZD71382.1 Putative serine protease HhoA [Acaryochloris thomasi RCC1774]